MVSKKALEEFKVIYKAEFGEKLSDEEAMGKGTKFLNLMKVIMRPVPKNTSKLSSEINQKGGNL